MNYAELAERLEASLEWDAPGTELRREAAAALREAEGAQQNEARLRVILCETAREVGAALSPQASIEFMCELPLQARAFVRNQSREAEALRALLAEAREYVWPTREALLDRIDAALRGKG